MLSFTVSLGPQFHTSCVSALNSHTNRHSLGRRGGDAVDGILTRSSTMKKELCVVMTHTIEQDKFMGLDL